MKEVKVRCWHCGKTCAVTSKNRIRKHYDPRIRLIEGIHIICKGSGTLPMPGIYTEGGR